MANNSVQQVSMTKNNFCIYEDDGKWLLQQPDGVRILWLEAAMADPTGKGGIFHTKLKKTAFWNARQAIEEYGAFTFERICSGKDSRETIAWRAYNLHGTNNNAYWSSKS